MGGIIQIHVTRFCDKSCFNCTQGSQLRGPASFMSVSLFEQAVLSLKDFWGVVGLFGGNPAISPHFEEYCEILREHIPKRQCGLWCNRLIGKGEIARATFNPAHSNFNVHLDQEAYEEFQRDWPEAAPLVVGLDEDSRHSPPWVALMDVEPDETARWELITNCDVNKYWSSLIGVFRGELRAWFCELAGAQSMLHQNDPNWPDLGVKVEPGWWLAPIEAYEKQVEFHCHRCGVPLRGHGELAVSGTTEQVSQTHADVYRPKDRNRSVQIVTTREQLAGSLGKMVDYIGNAKE